MIKEDTFTTGSLANRLPKTYERFNKGIKNKLVRYMLNLFTDVVQIKHMVIIVLTLMGLFN